MSDMIKVIGGRRVLHVMAADAEYGPHLKKRFAPVMIGVGPVESAIHATRALIEHKPDILVSLGSAGSRTLEQGAVYQASSVSYRDMDASPLGFEKGRTPFLDLPAEILLPLQIPGIGAKRLSTGGNIVSGTAYDLIDADMVDMESFAIHRACMIFGVPMIGLRGISDGASDLHHFDDWTQYLHVVDENLAAVVDRFSEALADGSLLPR